MEAPKPDRRRAPRRSRADAPRRDDTSERPCVRMYVSLPVELHRKLAAWCKWMGTSPSDFVREHAEDALKGFVVSLRSGPAPGPGIVPIRTAGPEPEEAERRAG